MFSGSFSPSIFFKISTYSILITLVIIYYVSQIEGHEPPFPKCWISDCAAHFPEFVFFRIATISGAALLVLGWLVNYFYLLSIAKEHVVRIDKYQPKVCMIIGMMGAMLLMGSTANLDTGKRHDSWHTSCASSFFVLTLVAQIYNTVICCLVRLKIKTISLSNLYFKLALFALNMIQYYISTKYGAIGMFNYEVDKSLGNDVDKFLEWTLTLTVVLGFYSIGLDCDNFKFEYDQVPKESNSEERAVSTF